jgi:hypothetical protein
LEAPAAAAAAEWIEAAGAISRASRTAHAEGGRRRRRLNRRPAAIRPRGS